MMKLRLKDIISGFHEEIREGSCREQLPFFVLEVENENAAAWNGVPAAGKIPSCISCSLIIVSLRPVPKEPGQSKLPRNYNGD